MKKQILATAAFMWAAVAAASSDHRTLAALDSNGDGMIGVYEAAELPGLGVWFVELDQNADAQLSATELARFDALDAPLTAAE